MARRPNDRYANLASASVTESSAGTLTFGEILTGISLATGMGMVIDQIDYWFSAGGLQDVIADADVLLGCWSSSNVPTVIAANDQRFLHYCQISQASVGAVVSQSHFIQPFSYQFFPAIPFAGPRLYAGVQGISLAAATSLQTRLYFRYLELSSQEYLELAEAFTLVG